MAPALCWQETGVLSHWNYSSFRFWLGEIASPAEREQVLQEVFLTIHRSAPCFDADELIIGNGNFDIRQVPCQKETCPRCEQGVGGYVFDWVSPKWTAVEFIADPALSVQENRSRGAQAFHTAVAAANLYDNTLFDHLVFIRAKLGEAPSTSTTGSASSSA